MHRPSPFAATGPKAGHGQALSLKRSRSTSPDPLAKRRVPVDYAPSIYSKQAQLPPSIARSLSEDVTLTRSSSTVEHPTLRSAQRLTPLNDCVTRTEALHLSTPPPTDRLNPFGAPPFDEQHHTRRTGNDDSTRFSQGLHPPQHAYTQHHEEDSRMEADDDAPSGAHHLHQDSTARPTSSLHGSHFPPHEAPPLHLNLAGSPHGMSRSSSSSSSLATAVDHQQLYDTRSSAIYDDSAAVDRPSPAVQTQPRPRQGWKVTFGYRSDCQKCIDRVPGHYSHVVMEATPKSSTGGRLSLLQAKFTRRSSQNHSQHNEHTPPPPPSSTAESPDKRSKSSTPTAAADSYDDRREEEAKLYESNSQDRLINLDRRPSSEAHDVVHCPELNDLDFQANRRHRTSSVHSAPSSPTLRFFKSLARPFFGRKKSTTPSGGALTPRSTLTPHMTPAALATTTTSQRRPYIGEAQPSSDSLEPVPPMSLSHDSGAVALGKHSVRVNMPSLEAAFQPTVGTSDSHVTNSCTPRALRPLQEPFESKSASSHSQAPLDARIFASSPRSSFDAPTGMLRPTQPLQTVDSYSSLNLSSLDPPLPSPQFRHRFSQPPTPSVSSDRPQLISRFSDWTSSDSYKSMSRLDTRETLNLFPLKLTGAQTEVAQYRPGPAPHRWSTPTAESFISSSCQDADDEGGGGAGSDGSRPSRWTPAPSPLRVDVSTQTPAFSPVVKVSTFARAVSADEVIMRGHQQTRQKTTPDRRDADAVSGEFGGGGVHRDTGSSSSAVLQSSSKKMSATDATASTSPFGSSTALEVHRLSTPARASSGQDEDAAEEFRDTSKSNDKDGHIIGWRGRGKSFLNKDAAATLPSWGGNTWIDREDSKTCKQQDRAHRAIKRQSC
ncbi:hypothetical protein ACM66B_004952 [Microbotryomycetes sp. NB124-2]